MFFFFSFQSFNKLLLKSPLILVLINYFSNLLELALSSKSSGRPLVEYEKHFVDQLYRVFNQFAIEVENPKDLPLILEKIKKEVSGFYIKTDGYNLIDNQADPENVTIHKIPKDVKTLVECCDWIYHTYTPSFEYALASIAADETRIVINENHSICDGGFFVTLLQKLQDPSSKDFFTKRAPIPGDLRK